MDQVQVKAELIEAQSSVVVSASPAVGGQLLAVPAGAYDVTVQIPQLPIRAKWRVGTSGDWNEFEGGEGFTVSGADSARVYLAKFAEQSASVTAAVKVRTVGSFTTGSAQVVNINAPAGRIRAIGMSAAQRHFPLTNAGLPAGRGVATQWQFPAPVEALQLHFVNMDTAAGYTPTAAGVIPVDVSGSLSGVGTPSLFSSLPTLAAASGSVHNVIPTFGESDIIACASANIDNLFQVRVWNAGTASAIQVPANYISGYNAQTGQALISKTLSTDLVTGWPELTAPFDAANSQWWYPAMVKAYYSVPSRTIAVVGGSVDRGFLTSDGLLGVGQYAATSLSSENLVVSCANFAIASQTHAASMATARAVITALKPDAILLKNMSYNSGTPTVALMASQWADLLITIDHALKNGVLPIPVTMTPIDSWGAEETALMLAHNAKTLALRNILSVIDTYASVVDPERPNKWVTGESADGIHPGVAARARMNSAGVKVIKSALYI